MTTENPTSAPEPPPQSTTTQDSPATQREAPPSGGRKRDPGAWFATAWAILAMPLLSIVLALIVGAVIIVITSSLGSDTGLDFGLPFQAYKALWEGSLGSENGRVTALVQAAPLILAGLGVGLGFKAGLFNIGGAGQFLLGGLGCVIGALVAQDFGALVAIPFALLCGAIFGAAWGFIPGFLKAFSGAHEVVTTIMLNFIAYALISYIITGPLRQPRSPQPISPTVGDAALPILFGRDGHLGILLAFLAVPIVWFVLYRMTIGFEIRAVGANPDASRYAGMKPRRLITLTMSAAGLLAGLAGTINMLGINHQMTTSNSNAQTVGFDAITVALLGRSHPVGIVFAALLFGTLRAGAPLMQINAGVPAELVDLLEAIILFFLVASPVLRRVLRLRGVKSSLGTTETMSRTYGSEAIR